MTGLSILHCIVYDIIQRWDIPEVCDGSPMLQGNFTIVNPRDDGTVEETHINRPLQAYQLTSAERERLDWVLNALLGALQQKGQAPVVPAHPALSLLTGEKRPPDAPICRDPLNQTLEKLKGCSVAKDLIRFLTRQAGQKATLVDTARYRKSGRREPTRRDIESTMQQVRRTAESLALRDAPLRIEYCWIQQSISLVDRNGNPATLHINETADVAK
jgi:hypothetical protein